MWQHGIAKGADGAAGDGTTTHMRPLAWVGTLSQRVRFCEHRRLTGDEGKGKLPVPRVPDQDALAERPSILVVMVQRPADLLGS